MERSVFTFIQGGLVSEECVCRFSTLAASGCCPEIMRVRFDVLINGKIYAFTDLQAGYTNDFVKVTYYEEDDNEPLWTTGVDVLTSVVDSVSEVNLNMLTNVTTTMPYDTSDGRGNGYLLTSCRLIADVTVVDDTWTGYLFGQEKALDGYINTYNVTVWYKPHKLSTLELAKLVHIVT